jgi:hypothetical protein
MRQYPLAVKAFAENIEDEERGRLREYVTEYTTQSTKIAERESAFDRRPAPETIAGLRWRP